MSADDLSSLPAGSLEPALRASIEQARAIQRDKQGSPESGFWTYAPTEHQNLVDQAELAQTIIREWSNVFMYGSFAICTPRISRADTERAMRCLQAALEAATKLDPPEEV